MRITNVSSYKLKDLTVFSRPSSPASVLIIDHLNIFFNQFTVGVTVLSYVNAINTKNIKGNMKIKVSILNFI